MRAVIFGERLRLWKRKAKTYFTLGEPSYLTEYRNFFVCVVKSHLYAEVQSRVIKTPPSGRAMGASGKPQLHEWRLMEQSTWAQAMSGFYLL